MSDTTHHAAFTASELREQFHAARGLGKRAKDAAESLGVSEGEAIAAHAGEHSYALKATPLHGPWVEILQGLEACGPVMALTRNTSTVHEKTGVYQNVSVNGHVGLALSEDIDLRLFFMQWHAGFAVSEPANDPAKPPAQSLQFFNAHGVAVHKVFVRDATHRGVFNALVAKFAQPAAAYVFTPSKPQDPPRADTEIDAPGLASAWAAMQDTHDFFGLTRKFGVERQQSFRLVEGRFAWRAATDTLHHLLSEAAMDATPIMVFVSSGGCIQIHSGPVKRIEPLVTANAQWINVLDAGFNLHLREDMVANVWIVEKPTVDGVVTSVEAFDPTGELMAMLFGVRKPGQPELQAWRDLVGRLPRRDAVPA